MSFKRYASGAWEDIASVKRYSSGAWTDCSAVKKYSNGAWTPVWQNGLKILLDSKGNSTSQNSSSFSIEEGRNNQSCSIEL